MTRRRRRATTATMTRERVCVREKGLGRVGLGGAEYHVQWTVRSPSPLWHPVFIIKTNLYSTEFENERESGPLGPTLACVH